MKVGYEGIDQGNQIIELEAQVAALQREIAALRADKAALEIRERELERDLEGAMSQCAILSADVERVAVAFHLWPGASGDMAQAFAAFRASKDYPK